MRPTKRDAVAALAAESDVHLGRQRAEGRVSLSVRRAGPASVLDRVAEAGSLRVRFPRVFDTPPEAVLVNTGGGVAAGDRFAVEAEVGAGAALVVTTVAAEKVYKSDGATASVANRLVVGPGGSCHWLPQETILFDRLRLSRSFEADVAPDATLLALEATVFGRAARGERVEGGALRDRWRVRRGGRLVFADDFVVSGAIADRMAHPAVAGGARAMATVLYAAPGAPGRLEEARALLGSAASECGATAVAGCLVLRWLSPDIATLRHDLARFMTGFRGAALPRVWQT